MFADISEMNRAFGRVSLRRAYSSEAPEAIFAALLSRLTIAFKGPEVPPEAPESVCMPRFPFNPSGTSGALFEKV